MRVQACVRSHAYRPNRFAVPRQSLRFKSDPDRNKPSPEHKTEYNKLTVLRSLLVLTHIETNTSPEHQMGFEATVQLR